MRGGCSRELFYLSSRRKPGPRASVFSCRDTATWLACRGLRSSCRRRKASPLFGKAGSLSLACPREGNQREGPPDDAPSGLRPPGARAGYGVFRQDIPVLSKNWPHPCGHPSGFPPPARRVIRGPLGQEPHQEPNNALASRAGSFFVGAHLCATSLRSDTPTLRGRAQVRSYKGARTPWGVDLELRSALCGSAPCARQTYGAVHRSMAVAHRVRSHRPARVVRAALIEGREKSARAFSSACALPAAPIPHAPSECALSPPAAPGLPSACPGHRACKRAAAPGSGE